MNKKIVIFTLLSVIVAAAALYAAVGCELNDPDRDVKRLFPESTGYKTLYVSVDRQGGPAKLKEIEGRLGDAFQGTYETIDVPYTMYRIMKGSEVVGFIHGVNQKGQYGGLQVVLALDPKGVIRDMYFQKLTSKGAAAFRDPKFGAQFAGLTLDDFKTYDVKTGAQTPPGKVSKIANPAPEAASDFKATLRAVKKDLILADEYLVHAGAAPAGK